MVWTSSNRSLIVLWRHGEVEKVRINPNGAQILQLWDPLGACPPQTWANLAGLTAFSKCIKKLKFACIPDGKSMQLNNHQLSMVRFAPCYLSCNWAADGRK